MSITINITNIAFSHGNDFLNGWTHENYIYCPDQNMVLDYESREVITEGAEKVKKAYEVELCHEQRRHEQRDEHAAFLASQCGYGHEEARWVFYAAIEYADGEPKCIVKDGIGYYQIGRNASHDFYIGFDSEGQMWKAADDYESWSAYKIDSLEGHYFGHL